MHKNIKTVAGCLTRVTCDISAPEGTDTTLSAYLVYEGESRPATLESAGVIIFPAVPYGHYAYEIRCGGKPVAFGHLLVRPSAFPHTDGVVDYTLAADLSTTDAAQISLTIAPGPRGPKGEDGDPAVFAALVAEHADDTTAHVTPEERTAWNAAAAGGACLVTKDANSNYLLGYGAQASGGVYFGTGLGQSSIVKGGNAVAVGYRSAAGSYGVAVGAQAYALDSASIAVGSGAVCSNGGQIALGYKAAALEGHASAVGLEAKAGYGYSTAIGEKTSTFEICSLILEARSPEPGCVLTLELLAKGMRATGEDGAIGDANAFITGGALRFGVRDLVSGERETMTISVASLWAMLRAAGGVSEKTVVNEYYY